MSEESKKVIGINRLAIFPMPLVLMPFELLPLHIFEPRYRKLLKDVRAERNLFGVSRLEPGESVEDKPPVGSVGCVAEIREAQVLEDGRSNVLTNGVIRYRLIRYLETDRPYPVAEVEFFEDDDDDDINRRDLADEVFELFKRVAKAAHNISGGGGQLPDIPKAEPEQLSFLIGAAFNLDIDLKYKMLETNSTSERLLRLKEIVEGAVDQVEETAKINKISRTNGHAKKDIDLGGI